MQAQFTKRRKEQEAAVAEAILHPLATLGAVAQTQDAISASSNSLSRPRTPVFHNTATGSTTTNSAYEATKAKGRGRWFGFLVLLAAVAAVGVYLLRVAPIPVQTVSTQGRVPASRDITFTITSNPIGALVMLDGKPLGRSPWKGQFPEERRVARLEIRADGHVPFFKDVTLNENVELEVQLEKEPLSVPEPAVSVKKPRPGAKVVRPTKGGKTTSNGGNCTPPYVLSADGIRVYKPECF
jgi:hypothetical protein